MVFVVPANFSSHGYSSSGQANTSLRRTSEPPSYAISMFDGPPAYSSLYPEPPENIAGWPVGEGREYPGWSVQEERVEYSYKLSITCPLCSLNEIEENSVRPASPHSESEIVERNLCRFFAILTTFFAIVFVVMLCKKLSHF